MIKLKRCVIVGQAEIKDYKRVKSYLKNDDFFVYCDGGLKHMENLSAKPDLIIGDFDSYEIPKMDVETIVLPCVKDDTDSAYALKCCIERGFKDFLFIGCIGQRLDHTLGNLFLLIMLKEKGLSGVMLDDYSEMTFVDDKGAFVEDSFSYFSLLSLSDRAEGITIENAKYPLNDGVIESSFQYGVSNEVIKGKTARIFVEKGNIILIKVF